MEQLLSNLRGFIPSLVALGFVGVLYVLSQPPVLADPEANELAERFRFVKLSLPELVGFGHKMDRNVHPSLRHLSAQISFVGAAVALADLDGDGLPNDLIYVDPRVDQVIVAPVPGTRSRYEPFTLSPSPLPFDSTTMAPMGCLVGDFNEDGWPDVLVYYWGRTPILFLQKPDLTVRGVVVLTRESWVPCELINPVERWYTGAATQADLDGDGHLDLIIGNYFPDGARVLDAKASGTESMPHSLSHAFNGGRSHLLLWGGVGSSNSHPRFREAEAGLEDNVAHGWTFAIGAADLDGDLLPEIYFVRDFGPDRLLHNRSRPGELHFALLRGERTFTTPRSKVVGRDSFNGMGIDFGDLNGDGWPDIFVSNITSRNGLHESNFLFLSTGKTDLMRSGIAPYQDASEKWGLSRSGWAWDVKLADFDNDGVLELVQACGFAKGNINRWPEIQEGALMNDELTSYPHSWPRLKPGDDVAGGDHNPFFVRASDGRYYDLASRLGLSDPTCSRGIAIGDVDGDGRLDFAVANQWGPSFFFHNLAPDRGEFLGLHLRFPIGEEGATVARAGHPNREIVGLSRPAIGATATVYLPDGRRLVAAVDGGTGHSGKRAPDLHFGLGRMEATAAIPVDLRWRGADGQLHSQTLQFRPGWHTVILGGKAGGNP